jgi:hypothetical protein
MARPKKILAEEPATERVPAPEPVAVQEMPVYRPNVPRQLRIERQGAQSEPYVRHFPQVRGGVCEFCGILDGNVPSQYQYKLCPHYRGMNLQCSYCPPSKDSDEVVRISKLEIVEHPANPGMIIAVCNSYDCERAHQKRFQLAHS